MLKDRGLAPSRPARNNIHPTHEEHSMAACEAGRNFPESLRISSLVEYRRRRPASASPATVEPPHKVASPWNDDPASQLLVIQCTDSPFFDTL